jgi:DNA-binding GntR family transcriptional regulator
VPAAAGALGPVAGRDALNHLLPTMPRSLVLKPVNSNFSLKEHIYAVLRDGITGMNIYAPDADLRLDERRMSEQLGISRTPIREALARLEQEGLVEIVPRRGVFIRRKSLQEVLEMIIAWAALEGMAARLAAARVGDKDVASLKKLAGGFASAEAADHLDEYSDANIRFHQKILELSGCGLLKEMADGLFVHMRAIRSRAMAEGDRVRRSLVDHQHIIAALEGHDGDAAERLVREHTMNLHAHVRRTWVTLAGAARVKTS